MISCNIIFLFKTNPHCQTSWFSVFLSVWKKPRAPPLNLFRSSGNKTYNHDGTSKPNNSVKPVSRDRSTYIELQSSCEPNRLGQTSVESGTWMGTFSSRPGRIEKTAKVDINLHLVGLVDHRWGKLMIVLKRPNAITMSFRL